MSGINPLAALTLSGGRKLGGMMSKRLEGANMVHAMAVQGIFNAHSQQAEHEQHLETLKTAHGMAGSGGFEVNTGSRGVRVSGTPAAKPGADGKPGATGTPGGSSTPGTPSKPRKPRGPVKPKTFNVYDAKGNQTHTAVESKGKSALPATESRGGNSAKPKPTPKPKAGK